MEVDEVKVALRALSEKATFAPKPSVIGSGSDGGGGDGGGDGRGGGGVVISQPQSSVGLGGTDVETQMAGRLSG